MYSYYESSKEKQSMNIKKSIQLTTSPLEELIENGESIDFRIDEEAWQDLQTGDHVEFW